jgi:chromosome segregation ATPase
MNIFYAVRDAIGDNIRAFTPFGKQKVVKTEEQPAEDKPTVETPEKDKSGEIREELEKTKASLKDVSKKYKTLSTDFSETAKRNELLKTQNKEYSDELMTAKKLVIEKENQILAYQGSIEKLEADFKVLTDNRKNLELQLKTAQTHIKKLEKAAAQKEK